jgi:protease-4
MRRGVRWALVFGAFALAFLGLLVLASWTAGPGARVPNRAILWVRVGPEIGERDDRSPIERALGPRVMTLRDHVRVLDAAAADRKVRAVVLHPQGFGGGWAMGGELRDAVTRLRASGKPVVAFLEVGETLDYYVASAAGRVVMMPGGVLLVSGLLSDTPFFKATLDKVGIEADLHHIGDYKNASDMWTRDSMSTAHREAANAILDGLYGELLDGVAASRSIARDRVAAAIDVGFLSAKRARDLGLVDDLLYEDELLDQLEDEVGDASPAVRAGAYLQSLRTPAGAPRIGLVYVTGTIVSGRSVSDPLAGELAGSDTIGAALRALREDGSVRAVVLRVDSPGGSGMASDAIWREVQLTRKRKPVVVSMGDVAASGGYYVAMGGDAIVAQPSTLTGSIGVISGKFSLRGLHDWAAVRREQIKRGRNADLFSDYQRFDPEQRELIRGQMQEFYADFIHKAALGRGLEDDDIDRVGQGRVWTGRQALERRLVDELGGLDRALEIARQKAGIAPGRALHLDVYPRPKGLFEAFGGETGDDARAATALARLVPDPARRAAARWALAARLAAEPYALFDERLLDLR